MREGTFAVIELYMQIDNVLYLWYYLINHLISEAWQNSEEVFRLLLQRKGRQG